MKDGYEIISIEENKKMSKNKKILIISIICAMILIASVFLCDFLIYTVFTPSIYLIGDAEIKLNVFNDYIELGVKASVNNEEIKAYVISSNIDTKKPR